MTAAVGETDVVTAVWVFTHQVPDGTWGGAGMIFRLDDIAGFVLDDAEAGAFHAKRRLAIANAERDAVVQ